MRETPVAVPDISIILYCYTRISVIIGEIYASDGGKYASYLNNTDGKHSIQIIMKIIKKKSLECSAHVRISGGWQQKVIG